MMLRLQRPGYAGELEVKEGCEGQSKTSNRSTPQQASSSQSTGDKEQSLRGAKIKRVSTVPKGRHVSFWLLGAVNQSTRCTCTRFSRRSDPRHL